MMVKRMQIELDEVLIPFTKDGTVEWNTGGELMLKCVPKLRSHLLQMNQSIEDTNQCNILYDKIIEIANKYEMKPEIKNCLTLHFSSKEIKMEVRRCQCGKMPVRIPVPYGYVVGCIKCNKSTSLSGTLKKAYQLWNMMADDTTTSDRNIIPKVLDLGIRKS